MFIDYIAIEKALRDMKPRSRLFNLIKAEMKRRNHWKGLAHGKPFNKGYDPRRKTKVD